MNESEAVTRKNRIDLKLKSSLLNWTIIHNDKAKDTSKLNRHAVEEFQTETGPADYALFVDGKLLGIIEAKKIAVGAENVLEQAKRYSRGVPNTVGVWRDYKVPFLYSTNGELIFHLDVRRKENSSYEIFDFHSPQAMLDRFNRNTLAAEDWFEKRPVSEIKRLRPYQIEAIEAIEKGLFDGKMRMLIAMATGTGKTFTLVSSIYRLLKSRFAKRILFLVDRRALAAQTVSAICAFDTPEGLKLDKDYEVYSSDIHINGAFLKEGELIGEIDTGTGAEKLDELEDERQFCANEIETKITSPDSTRKIITAIKKYTDQHEQEYNRFPKILIFAVNDLPHISHADDVVRTCKEIYGKGDDFAMKITGSPTVDRPLQKIRQFRNRPEPKIVVTVDMLTTGVDIPAIEMVVFMRMVKSRILWVQMLGRGTRLCPEINKEKFTIFDCFDGSLIEYFKNTTDFNVTLGQQKVSLSEIIEHIYDNRDQAYNIKRLIKRLRRIEKNIGAEARELFAKYIPDGDMKAYVDTLKENIDKKFTQTMKLLRNKEFQALLENYPRPRKVFFKGYDIVDTVEDEVMFRKGADYQKPGDYLKLFEEFVKQNPEQIEAIEILLSKPKEWNTSVLDDLREKLRKNDFSEKDLQKGHELVFKKPLADIISMIKHAADIEALILTATERVEKAVFKIARVHEFTSEQMTWLAYIKEHLIENLAIAETDFEIMPVFERHGGLGRAKLIFGNEFTPLIHELNEALAA